MVKGYHIDLLLNKSRSLDVSNELSYVYFHSLVVLPHQVLFFDNDFTSIDRFRKDDVVELEGSVTDNILKVS